MNNLESLRRTKAIADLEFERRVDTVVISGIAKRVYIDRIRRRQILTMKVKPNNVLRKQSAAAQIRRTGRALSKPKCCGEPRQQYLSSMMEALEGILHRKGLA